VKYVFFEAARFTRVLVSYLDDVQYGALRGHGSHCKTMPSVKKRDSRRAGSPKGRVVSEKRNLFDELMEGVEDMRLQRQGKVTLRSHEVEALPPLTVDARVIRQTRERLNVSRAVFARGLRISARTLENWEQGRARPNAQAAALILMVRRYPDTLVKLQSLDSPA
jgi:putative transcriptional regulator